MNFGRGTNPDARHSTCGEPKPKTPGKPLSTGRATAHITLALLLTAMVPVGCGRDPLPLRTPGLLAYWSFDKDQKDNASEDSGKSPILEISGVGSARGIRGQCLEFHGNEPGEQYAYLPDPGAFAFGREEDYTVEAWVWPAAVSPRPDYEIIVQKGDYGGYWQGFRLEYKPEGAFLFGLGSGQPRIRTTQTYEAEKWHHVLGVKSGTQIALWVNGVKQGEKSGATAGVPNQLHFSIGSRYHPRDVAWCFAGKIDEVAVYGRALSEKEIAQRKR